MVFPACRRVCVLLVVYLALVSFTLGVSGQAVPPTTTPPPATQPPAAAPLPVELEVGTAKTFTGATFDKTTVKSDGKGAVDLDTAGTIKGVKAGTVTFKGKQNDVNLDVTVTVKSIAPVITLTRLRPTTDAQKTISDENTAFRVVSGDAYKLTVEHHDADGKLVKAPFPTPTPSPVGTLTFNEGDGTVTFTDPPTAKGLVDAAPVAASLQFTLEDGSTHTLRFDVVEKPKEVSIRVPNVVHEDANPPVVVVVTGTANGTHQSLVATSTAQYEYKCDPGKITEDTGKLSEASVLPNRTLSIGRFQATTVSGVSAKLTITCTANVIGRASDTAPDSKTVEVTIAPSGGFIQFSPPAVTITAGDSAQITATAVDRLGGPTGKHVTWSLPTPTEAATITQDATNTVTLLTVSDPDHLPSNGILKLHARVDGTSGVDEIGGDMPVRIAFPTGFTFVRGSLEMIDAQTAHDLYGPATSRDFFIAKITILNDLKDDPKQHNAGASILVFSNSLAIGVNLEKNDGLTESQRQQLREAKTPDDAIALKQGFERQRYGRRFRQTGRDLAPDGDDPLWRPIEPEDLRVLGLPGVYPMSVGRFQAKDGDAKKTVPIYTCDDVWYAEQPVDASGCTNKDDATCLTKLQAQHDAAVAAARLRQLHYRPYPYDLVVKSFDPRDNRTARSITFRALTFAGVAASFITGVPNFKASNEFVSVNEKFGNVLVPGLSALWPNLRETQRQNLISDTMHPIEEVPFGSSLTKVVFLPKYPFQGFKANTWFRISEICPFDFQVEVAVAPKRQPVTAAVAPPVK